MAFSNILKIAFSSAFGAILVSSTLLFPLIKELNHTISEIKSIQEPLCKEHNKTVQVISKDCEFRVESIITNSGVIKENPSIKMKQFDPANRMGAIDHDTAVNSNILKEDIPLHRGN